MSGLAYDAMRSQMGPDPRAQQPQPPHSRPDGSTVDVSSIMGEVSSRYKAAREDRRKYEGIWRLCQAFVAGRQWVGLTRGRDARVVEEPNPRKRERHTANVLTQYYATAIGKLYDDNFMPDMLPARPDFEAEQVTKQAEHAFRFAWDQEVEAQDVILDMLIELVSFGTVATRCTYNTQRGPNPAEYPVNNAGKIIPIDENNPEYQGLMEKMAFGEPVEWRLMREGRIEWRTYSSFNHLPPPGVVKPRDFPWVILEEPVSLDDVKAMYGSRAQDLTEQTITSLDQVGVQGDAADAGVGKLKGHVMLRRMFERPTREFLNGRVVVWTGDTFLDEKLTLPYTVLGEPKAGIVFSRYHIMPRRYWGQGLLEPGIGPQRQRNRARSQHIEMKDKNLGRVYARKGALTEANTPVGKIMELIEVKQSVNPRTDILETQGVPPGPWIGEEKAMNDEDLEKVMGFRDLVNSESLKGVTAYAAFALQAEQEDKRVGPILARLRNDLIELSKYTACAIKQWWPTDKQIAIAGPDRQIQAMVYNGAKFPVDTYFFYPHGASVPRSPAAEIQKVFDIYDRSVSSGRPLGMEWLMGSLEAGQPLPFPQNIVELQKEKAQLENMLAAQGQAPVVSPLDDHQTHIAEHQLAVQQAILAGNPQVAQVLQAHIAEHEAAMQSQQQMAASVPSMQGDMGALGGPQAQAANAGAQIPPQLAAMLSQAGGQTG